MGPDALKVFCSYRSTDLGVVEEFARRLRERGLDAWFDRWEIQAGDDVVARMDSGVDGCDAALVFLSKAWLDGEWARDEYTSLALRKVEDGIRLVPVTVDDVDMQRFPARLRKLARRSVEDFEAIYDTLRGVDHEPGLGGALRADTLAIDVVVEQQPDATVVSCMSVDGASTVSAAVSRRLAAGGLDRVTSDETLALLGRRVGAVVYPGALDDVLGDLLDGGWCGDRR